jgi:ribosomal-protein-alanine N-acetyltransferase
MVEITELETDNLKLRQWLPSDYAPFAELNTDSEVMAFYPNTLNKSESNAFAQKLESLISKRGWGFWAVDLKAENCFIGFVGLHKPEAKLPFTPCIEIGWRLSKKYWGYGFATEGAHAALKYAFEALFLEEVVSFTSLNNTRSKAVMQRLNMVDTNQNFEHPNIPLGHQLREHVLYKITKEQWVKNAL